MDRHAPPPEMAAGGDRLSKLDDEVLGHILSFLPAREAARASSLSSRWRHVFAAVHTVSMAETDADHPAIRGYVSPPYRRGLDPLAPPVFSAVVTTALLSRHRRRRHRPVPLRALRVDMTGYVRADSAAVDQWVSYAVQQAAADHGLEIDLRLGRPAICDRAYSLRDSATIPEDDDDDDDDNAEDEQHDNAADDDDEKQEARDRSPSPAKRARSHSPSSSDYDDDALTLVFHPRGDGGDADSYSQNELRDAHRLRYNPHAVLAAAAAGGAMVVPCLRSTVREINLVHYQGGMAQRSLAKFLLCNAPAIAELFCVSAEGPLFMLEQLKQELRGWLMNKSAKTCFR
uniref:F-box domain-containing protein n=1 Tax=Oryza barthii TaxID=65489 RepID=A0A0D3HPC8_9ORYZ